MRNSLLLLTILGVASLWTTGCATRRVATATPTTDELPKLDRRERSIGASVAVEGRRDEPRNMLVPDFTPPEPTEEERLALGETEPEHDWLEFYQPVSVYEIKAYPIPSVIRTLRRGMGGAAVNLNPPTSVVSIGVPGGMTTGVYPLAVRPSSVG
ncbi:MAG: hypothetical protein KKB50_01655, partial [Planctomycetes bacterium]|nr:hypothetical protein [Planctomycetota bacterium]